MADDDIQPDIPFFYNTLEEAKVSVQADAKAKGYEVSTKRSYPDRRTGEVRRVDLVCSRGTTYKARSSDKSRARDSNTIKCDCSWEVRIIKFKTDTPSKWQLIVIDSSHNHEPADQPSALRGHRHREINTLLEEVDQLKTLTPAEIVDKFKANNPGTTIQPKDIYNAKTRLRRKRLGKYTPTQLLLKALHEKNWFVKFLLKTGSKRVSKSHRITY